MLLTGALVAALAWGVFAFGAVYPWAYAPLVIACVVVALLGVLPRRDVRLGRLNVPLVMTLALVAIVLGVQLVPLPQETLARVSPGTDRFLARYDMQYQALAATETLRQATGAPDSSPELKFGAYASAGGTRNASAAVAGSRHPISIDPPKTQLALAMYAAFALMLVSLARGLTARDVRRLAPAIVAVGVALALVGVVQKATYSGKIYGFWTPYATDAGPFGPFVNRNHFAGWMLMALPLGLGYFMALISRGMRGLRRPPVRPAGRVARTLQEWQTRALWFTSSDANRAVLTGVGVLVMGVSLVMTLSRSGIACFALALLVSGFVGIRRQARNSGRALAGAYVVATFVFAIGWVGLDTVAARFQLLSSDYTSRTEIWRDALAIFHDFPVLGAGVNAFGTAMSVYQTAAGRATHAGEAHNDYLQILADGGLALAAATVLLVAILARETRRRFRRDTTDETTYWIRVGAATGLLAVGLQECVEFSLQMPGNAALFATLAAIVVGKLPHRTTAGGPRRPSIPSHV